jgi:two-component system cell cycle sensor histidine kinase/response regulator CckA
MEFGTSLLDQASDAIHARDIDDRVRYWSQGAARLYGWPSEEAVGRRLSELLDVDGTVLGAARAEVERNGEWTGEIALRTRDGRALVVASRWTLVREVSGAPAALLAIETDITARKQLEDRYLRAQRMESIGTLARGIAHDLNNVLTPIAMSIDILRDATTDPGSLEILDTVETSTRRGADLVRQVMTFARGMEGNRFPVGVARLVQEVAELARGSVPPSIVVTTAVDGEVASVSGSPTQLLQVLLALVANARDAMPSGGALTLGARNVPFDQPHPDMGPRARPGHYVAFEVRDSGRGIPAGIQGRVFEPFFTTKAIGAGAGLGLSIARAIVRSHGGFVTLSSAEGTGTTITVYLPAGEVVEALAGELPAELPRGRGELVLLVDDDAVVRSVAQQALEASGYRVITARDGAEAIAMYRGRPGDIALVLTDVSMPVMDGLAMVQGLRRIHPGARVVAASGLQAGHTESALAEAGVRWFLPKPYAPEPMLRTVRAALDEA